mgnify:CR=1 FL=1
MAKNNFFNVIDFGSSKIRLSVFNGEHKEIFSKSSLLDSTNDNKYYIDELKKIVKIAEKEISTYIEDVILIFDPNKIFIIEVSLNKKTDKKMKVNQIYNLLLMELKHLIKNNYEKYELAHIHSDQHIINNKSYDKLPIDKKDINNLKVDFKLICLPKNQILDLRNNFNLNNLNITNIFCASYVKSLTYLNKLNINKISFLDIGWKRSTTIHYENFSLQSIKAIPVGSFHITQDISKIFKISIEEAEKIKKVFNKSETEFSYINNSSDNISVKEILDKKISIDLLKKVILYRFQEILDLAFKRSKLEFNSYDESELFLIGEGSILFNSNSFYLNDNFNFNSIKCYEENDTEICSSALKYYQNIKHKYETFNKKTGLFETFFNFFDK